jgi:aspartyl-tRNA(Asn)/glutamyl-tRNA(Gln) amidotransferase subunit C
MCDLCDYTWYSEVDEERSESDERGHPDYRYDLYSSVFSLRSKALEHATCRVGDCHYKEGEEECLLDRLADREEVPAEGEEAAEKVADPQDEEEKEGYRLDVFESVFHEREYILSEARRQTLPREKTVYNALMQLNVEQVRHIAKLARLGLSDEEVKKFSTQLTNILQYVEVLGEVDTSNVEPTNQVTGLTNVMRPDVLMEGAVTRDELLGCSELPVERDQIRVKPVIE